MSTIRYVGDAVVRLTYCDCDPRELHSDGTFRHPNGSYRCHVRAANGEARVIIVGVPAFISKSVDCPEAFDDAASAAVSFATDEQCMADDGTTPLDIQEEWNTEGTARVIQRSKPKPAWWRRTVQAR
jgi:hypothetical protein